MHYNPSASPSSPLYPVATGSFPLEGKASHLFFLLSLFRRADRSFLGYLLFMSRRTLPWLFLPLSSITHSSYIPVMLEERERKEEAFPPSSSFQFKFASVQEHGAFHSQTRPRLSRLDQRRTFRHLINPLTGVHVYQVQEHWKPFLRKSILFSQVFD